MHRLVRGARLAFLLTAVLATSCQGAQLPFLTQATSTATSTATPRPTPTPTPIPSAYDVLSRPAEASAYRLLLRMTTTSDWTRVAFPNATMAVTRQTVLEGADAPELFTGEMPELQIAKKGFDQSRVMVEYEVYLSDIEGDSLAVAIGKGHIGATTVDVFNLNGEEPQALESLSHAGVASEQDPLNRRYFDLSVAEIAQGGPRPLPVRSYPKTALAFYYPWYGLAGGASHEARVWGEYTPVRTPASGFYDSQDPDTVRRQIQDARAAGIDGFIVSWWGVDDFTDRALRRAILPVAGEEQFAISIYYENYGQSRAQIASDFAYLIEEYGGRPAFMRLDHKPVLFVYDAVTTAFGREDWEAVFQDLGAKGLACFCIADGLGAAYHLGDESFSYLFDFFQGVHNYSPLGYDQAFLEQFYATNALKASASGLLFAATIAPGFDNSSWAPVDGKQELVIDREGGDLYRRTWAAALASDPDWILITSFNEWPEGTEIEPSEELGRRYLDLTKELLSQWKP